jgi:hypothetical protein
MAGYNKAVFVKHAYILFITYIVFAIYCFIILVVVHKHIVVAPIKFIA